MTHIVPALAALLDVLATLALIGLGLVVALIVWVAVELYRLPACNWRQRDRDN